MTCTKPSSWMKDAHDLPKTVPLFAIIYSNYLFGQLLVGKIEKCPKRTEAQSCDDAIQSETARVAARGANSRAEILTLELGNSVQRAAEAERRATDAQQRALEAEQRALEAERRLSGWNSKFPATVLKPLSDPAFVRLHRENRVHTQDSSRLGQLLRSRCGLERSDSLESGKIVYGPTQK
ncbi:hypothetical protein PENPOL_c003G00933 [Penicillium polonicum]|uniref:Uncharacterized protein n=1 Tax=Penicillium polonicum TaxID=60169 RepID=A0A1V6NT93_PENPO|nr:hypothetical protein PENPOL_c003G00933 [Penicillium polonicum]